MSTPEGSAPGGDEDDDLFGADDDGDAVAGLEELETFGTTSQPRSDGGLKVPLPQV